ncbi:MAG: FGGY-family carbohydrate kinase, partial [Ktedonobacteraceae bacterium]
LTLHTTPMEIALAALEAVVFQLCWIYDQLSNVLADQSTHPRLIASGTALLNSSILAHILADTLNRPLELTETSEASARGAALLALETLGILPDLAQIAPAISTVVEPDPLRHTLYTEARERQQHLYEAFIA